MLRMGAGERARSLEGKDCITCNFHSRQAANLRRLGPPGVTSDWDGVGQK